MNLKEQLGEEWYGVLKNEFYNHYMKVLYSTLRKERAIHKIHPKSEDVFKAYRTTPLSKVKVLIYGQDPYPTRDYANGLAFSSNESMEDPPKSLQNIFKELEEDIEFRIYHNPDLTRWAKQGVMLLNRVLTTREGHPGLHRGIGWEKFTDKTIEILCKQERPIVFILWGKDAQTIIPKIPDRHKIIKSSHPSPLSAYRSFFGSKCFSRTNDFLIENKQKTIDWLKDE